MSKAPPKGLTRGPNPQLRAFHWLGNRVIDVIGKGNGRLQKTYGHGAVQSLCDELQKTLDSGKLYNHQRSHMQLPRLTLTAAYQARRFANRVCPEQLDALCSLGQSPGETALSVSHVLPLLRVTPQQRRTLARRCSKEA